MGRQLSVVLDPADEIRFLEYVRSLGPIRLFVTFASSPDALSVDTFREKSFTHLLWYTDFGWSPEYAQATTGQYYVRNAGVAPVLEYTRPPASRDEPGRLYWANAFSGQPAYDTAAFGQRVDAIWRWVRSTAHRGQFAGRSGIWIFPSAQGGGGGATDVGAA